MPTKLLLRRRIKRLEKEIRSLRMAFIHLVRDEDLTPDDDAYESWRCKMRRLLPSGKLRDALRVRRSKN